MQTLEMQKDLTSSVLSQKRRISTREKAMLVEVRTRRTFRIESSHFARV